MLFNKKSFPALDYHWSRLKTSCELIGINIPFSKKIFAEQLQQLININELHGRIASVRLTLTHGEAARGILPSVDPEPNYMMSSALYNPVKKTGFSAIIARTTKNENSISSSIKSLSYIDNVLAKKEAVVQGADEAIMLNSRGFLADGAIHNIFCVKNGTIYTPSLSDGALPGVVREIILRGLKHDYNIIEKSISKIDAYDADEVFLTNALTGIQSVFQLDQKKYHTDKCALAFSKMLVEQKDYI